MAKMMVETFEQQEVTTEDKSQEVVDQESIAIIQQLGLKGQLSLVQPDKDESEEDKSKVFPYRLMTKQEFDVYKELCPERSELEDYKAGPIPLRVLQVAAHAKQFTEVIGSIEVWSAEDHLVKDPILVGCKRVDWRQSYYLLARWGEELEDFQTLTKKATEKVRVRFLGSLGKIKIEVETALAVAKGTDGSTFLGRSTPSFHCF